MVLADVVDRANIWMIERGGGLRFALKALESLRIIFKFGRRNFSATARCSLVSSAL